MKKLLATFLVMVTSAASAAQNVVIIDGDTIAIGHERIRILSIDTPETFRSRCENELVLGLKAKERLRALVNTGDVVYEPAGKDRYGRTLARVFVWDHDQKVDVGETLIKEGHALRYRAGHEAKLERLRVWCGPDATLEGGSSWTGNAQSADKYRLHRRPATGEWPTNCKWMITPTWGLSWCGNPQLSKG